MKKFRSLFLAAVIVAGSTPTLMPAQADTKAPKAGKRQREKHRGSMQKQMEMMAQYLELTDAQKARLKPIMEQAQQRSLKVRNDKSLSPEQKRAKMKTIRGDSWKKINPILTKEQRRKIAAMRQNRGPRSGNQKTR